MAASNIKVVIFDCFGVLYLDTNVSLQTRVDPSRRQELSDVFTSGNYGYLNKEDYISRVSEITSISTQDVEAYIAAEHHLNAPLIDILRSQIKPKFTVGLLSNIGRGWIDDFFDKHELHQLFDEVVLSGEEGMTKPHPEIFELAAERLGVRASECLMIDDVMENCEGAERAGMQPIHFTDNDSLLEEFHRLKVL